MDDLLSAFDPLHSSKQPLFQQTPSPSTSASTAAASSSGLARQQQQRQQPHHAFINPHQQPPRLAQAAPVSAKDAPLLLDDTHDDPLWSSSSASRGDLLSHPGFSVQQRAEARQRDILSELETADQIQHLAQQQASQPAHSRADSAAAAGIVPGHQRPGRHSGFSPPRRMSRSGLMRDDEHHPPSSQQQYHSTHSHYHHHAHGMAGPSLTDSIPSSGAGSSETGGSSNISLVNPLAHASLSPSGLSTEPSELFHPSSPPSGSTLEAVRRQSDHFRALGVPVGAHAAPNSLPIDLMSLQDSDAQHHPPRRRDTELDRTAASALNGSGSNPTLTPASSEATASKRTAAIQSAFAIAPPPRADAAAAGNGTADHTTPTSLSASPKSLASGNLGGGGPSSSSWTTKFKPKIARKLPSFDFPTTFAHMHDEPPSYPSSGSHSPSKARSQRTSPAASLLIDTEPLAPVQRVVPPPARASRRILTEDVTEGIRAGLPSRIKLCKTWTLLYSLDDYGTSLTTLYDRVQAGLRKSAGGCVLAVQDTNGAIFGAYVNEAFHKQDTYYGNGECFLWKVDSFPSKDSFRIGPIVRTFRWTGRNDYLILSNGDFVSVGNDTHGKFGLYVDKELMHGFSASCETFNNEPLASVTSTNSSDGSEEAKFEIVSLECWAVG